MRYSARSRSTQRSRLVGPPNPGYKTAAGTPTWNITVQPVPPMGGMTFVFQAYAVDTSLLPDPSAYMISNPWQVTLN